MAHRVVFTPESEEQLAQLYGYISAASSPDIAERYVSGIIDFCEQLEILPQRGMMRDDIRPGLRVLGYRRRVAIAFAVEDSQVSIIGIFYGGQGL